MGSKFFLFRVDPFLEGLSVKESKQEVTKIASYLEKMAENLPLVSSSLKMYIHIRKKLQKL